MIINTLNNLVIDDDFIDGLTTEELTVWLHDYIQNNFDSTWGIKIDDHVWVCPLTNHLIAFGSSEPDWRDLLGS